MKIRLMKSAIADMDAIKNYIAADNKKMAESVNQRIFRSITLIGEQPNIGRPLANYPGREWSVPGLPYVIPYRISGDTIEIVRVFHTSRRRPESWS